MCSLVFFNIELIVNRSWHAGNSHTTGSTHVCVCMCTLKAPRSEHQYWHDGNPTLKWLDPPCVSSYGLSNRSSERFESCTLETDIHRVSPPLWIRMCVFKSCSVAHRCLQPSNLHSTGFSPVWVCICCWILAFRINRCSHPGYSHG